MSMMLQDRFKRLFSDKTLRDQGTLRQLNNESGSRNVTADATNSFNYADNFIRFITEAHVVHLAMKLLGTDDPSASASQAAVDASTKFLHDLCQDIVQHAWLMPSITDVTDVADFVTDDDRDTWSWCICGESRSLLSCSPYDSPTHVSSACHFVLGTSYACLCPSPLLTLLIMLCVCVCADRSDVDMVRCCCNTESHFATWFHADCVNLDVLPAADKLWWCSDECR